MAKIGEDRTERLDVTPAQFQVIVTIRPRYACPKGRAGVSQAPAPAHLIEAGLPTEAMLAQVIVSKYSEHLPLYRQAQVFARHGVMIERSTLADWVGRAAFIWRPSSIGWPSCSSAPASCSWTRPPPRCSIRDGVRPRPATCGQWRTTIVPSAAPIRRAWCFATRPVAAASMQNRCSAGFNGVLQVDGYAGYNRLEKTDRQGGSPLRLAYPQDAEGRQSRRGAHGGDGSNRGDLSATRGTVALRVYQDGFWINSTIALSSRSSAVPK